MVGLALCLTVAVDHCLDSCLRCSSKQGRWPSCGRKSATPLCSWEVNLVAMAGHVLRLAATTRPLIIFQTGCKALLLLSVAVLRVARLALSCRPGKMSNLHWTPYGVWLWWWWVFLGVFLVHGDRLDRHAWVSSVRRDMDVGSWPDVVAGPALRALTCPVAPCCMQQTSRSCSRLGLLLCALVGLLQTWVLCRRFGFADAQVYLVTG
jgi:hypothetical protein